MLPNAYISWCSKRWPSPTLFGRSHGLPATLLCQQVCHTSDFWCSDSRVWVMWWLCVGMFWRAIIYKYLFEGTRYRYVMSHDSICTLNVSVVRINGNTRRVGAPTASPKDVLFRSTNLTLTSPCGRSCKSVNCKVMINCSLGTSCVTSQLAIRTYCRDSSFCTIGFVTLMCPFYAFIILSHGKWGLTYFLLSACSLLAAYQGHGSKNNDQNDDEITWSGSSG